MEEAKRNNVLNQADQSAARGLRARASNLAASLSHRTELPTAAHFSQSMEINAAVENDCCRNGM